jgi:hypothetical protein
VKLALGSDTDGGQKVEGAWVGWMAMSLPLFFYSLSENIVTEDTVEKHSIIYSEKE